jgi:hypothetical protein
MARPPEEDFLPGAVNTCLCLRPSVILHNNDLSLPFFPSDGFEKRYVRADDGEMAPAPTDVAAPTTLRLKLRASERPDNHTLDILSGNCSPHFVVINSSCTVCAAVI